MRPQQSCSEGGGRSWCCLCKAVGGLSEELCVWYLGAWNGAGAHSEALGVLRGLTGNTVSTAPTAQLPWPHFPPWRLPGSFSLQASPLGVKCWGIHSPTPTPRHRAPFSASFPHSPTGITSPVSHMFKYMSPRIRLALGAPRLRPSLWSSGG